MYINTKIRILFALDDANKAISVLRVVSCRLNVHVEILPYIVFQKAHLQSSSIQDTILYVKRILVRLNKELIVNVVAKRFLSLKHYVPPEHSARAMDTVVYAHLGYMVQLMGYAHLSVRVVVERVIFVLLGQCLVKNMNVAEVTSIAR